MEKGLQLYAHEGYVLAWKQPSEGASGPGEAHVVFKEDAPPHAMLRALWQAHWLAEHAHTHASAGHAKSSNGNGNGSSSSSGKEALLAASLQALEQQFDGFLSEATQAGWDCDKVLVRPGHLQLRLQ